MPKRFATAEERKVYNGNHYRVRKERGSASEFECFSACGMPAAEWAQDPGTDGSSNDHFKPMCRPCHQRYDNRWNDDERSRVSATMRSKGLRPPSALGRKRSEETKARMSAAQKQRYARMRGEAI